MEVESGRNGDFLRDMYTKHSKKTQVAMAADVAPCLSPLVLVAPSTVDTFIV